MIGRRGFFRYSTALFASRLLRPADAPAAFSETSEVPHPLDPLTSEEIREASKILKASGNWTPDSRFASLFLREPSKEEVLSWHPGAPISRQASAVIYRRADNRTFESTIDLPSRLLLNWKQMEGVQPWTLDDDAFLLREIIRSNPEWQEAMRKRGIKDFDQVQIEPESAGYQFLKEQQGERLVGAIFFYRGGSENPYARPITGLMVFVNLTKRTVFKIFDDGVLDVPRKAENLDENSSRPLRKAPKPLRALQPPGPGLDIQGHEVRWQQWRFRFAMTPREGLVLHTVGYENEGRIRHVLYRASFSEMFVPYGDPTAMFYYNDSFDEGDGGMGRTAHPLQPGTDCPENAVYFDAVFPDERGEPAGIPRLVGLYERDAGVLWKHVDSVTGHSQSRRGRELVLTYFDIQGNYDYGISGCSARMVHLPSRWR